MKLGINKLNQKELVSLYVSLVNKKREIEAQIKELKEIAILNKEQDLISKKELFRFTAKKIELVPHKLLQLNQGALSELYKSALGGKSFLKEHGLKVTKTESYVWNSKVVKGAR